MEYEERVHTLRELLDDAEERMKAASEEYNYFRTVLDRYVSDFGSKTAKAPKASTRTTGELADQLQSAPPRQMLQAWASAHFGRIVMKDLVGAAFDSGRYESRTKAHRTLWSAVTQAKKRGEYVRVSQGVFERPQPELAPVERETGQDRPDEDARIDHDELEAVDMEDAADDLDTMPF